MVYTPLFPDWFYSYFVIPDLEIIRKELKKLINEPDKQIYATNASYYNIDSVHVYNYCPVLKEYLKSIGLQNKFRRILVSKKVILNNIHKVHVDAYNPYVATHSINIGISDYEDSYTAWFKTDKIKLIDAMKDGLNPKVNYGWLPRHEATEIKRVLWDERPLLVNTTILHSGISNNINRIICGLRFYPELTNEDIIRLGIKKPHIQED